MKYIHTYVWLVVMVIVFEVLLQNNKQEIKLYQVLSQQGKRRDKHFNKNL